MRNFCTLATAVAALWAGSASALVIDFEEFAEGAINPPSGDTTSRGFVLDYFNPPGDPPGNPVIWDSGTNKSYINCPNCLPTEQIELYTISGELFSIFSIDVGSLLTGASEYDFVFTGFLDGGGIVTTSALDLTTIQTVNFDSSWSGLTSLRIDIINDPANQPLSGASYIDNIVVTPIPAAVWLFGSGLVLLGWVRRFKGD